MTTLAIDLSTETGTLALVENGRILLEREWTGGDHRRRPIFLELHGLIESGALEWARLDRLAVCIGPGAFSGLRVAVSLVQALALPDAKPVTAVSSARALAGLVLKETGAVQVAVMGDARRNELWAGCFGLQDGVGQLDGEWIVAAADNLPDRMKMAGTVWVSPDWDRLDTVLTPRCPAGVTLLRERRIPRAAMVAEVAEALAGRGMEGEPHVPLYVHPAVSVAPRF